MAEETAGQDSLICDELAAQLASILEVDGQEMEALAHFVGTALADYLEQGPKELSGQLSGLHKNIDKVSKRVIDLRKGLRDLQKLQPLLDEHAREAPTKVLQSAGLLTLEQSLDALRRILLSLRVAKGGLPFATGGRPGSHTRYLLVHRLGLIYAKYRPPVMVNGTPELELPTRSHDGMTGRDTGRFLNFVTKALGALGDPRVLRGIDGCVRQVCEDMGKTRET